MDTDKNIEEFMLLRAKRGNLYQTTVLSTEDCRASLAMTDYIFSVYLRSSVDKMLYS